MAAKPQEIRQDIPAAFDAYTLLLHFLDSLPVEHTALSDEPPSVELAPAIHFDANRGRVLALIPISVGELDAISYWYTLNMMSKTVKQMPGLLALPFCLETHAKMEVLIPDWCGAFFVDGEPSHCVPILVMRSMLSQKAVGQDWVDAALARLRVFALPTDAARQSAQACCD
ncbi:MAG: hypothetical protein LBE22_03800 [Azoarcus sp.]|nr:hypothetical protein [Azoarcus sp.]